MAFVQEIAPRRAHRERPRHPTTAARAGAIGAVLAMPVLATALGSLTWDAALAVADELGRSPSLSLSPVTTGDVMSVAAGVVGTAIAGYLSVTAVLLLATARHSRARHALARITPHAWRRLVTTATTGALAATMAIPAAASPEVSDAGWVPQQISQSPPSATAHEREHPVLPALSPPPPARAPAGTSPTVPQATPQHAWKRAAGSEAGTHVVVPGESLWSITADLLGEAGTTDAAVATAWPQLYAANRDVVGHDPELIRPGDELTVPQEWAR